MTQNELAQNNRQPDWLPEVLGAHPWIDMDDGQRRAHEKQMENAAAQTAVETEILRQKTARGRLLTGWMYFWRFGVVFVLGFAIGLLCGMSLQEYIVALFF